MHKLLAVLSVLSRGSYTVMILGSQMAVTPVLGIKIQAYKTGTLLLSYPEVFIFFKFFIFFFFFLCVCKGANLGHCICIFAEPQFSHSHSCCLPVYILIKSNYVCGVTS